MLGPNLRKILINWNWSRRERRKKKDQIQKIQKLNSLKNGRRKIRLFSCLLQLPYGRGINIYFALKDRNGINEREFMETDFGSVEGKLFK